MKLFASLTFAFLFSIPHINAMELFKEQLHGYRRGEREHEFSNNKQPNNYSENKPFKRSGNSSEKSIESKKPKMD